MFSEFTMKSFLITKWRDLGCILQSLICIGPLIPTFYHMLFNYMLHITEDRQIIISVILLGQHAHSLDPLLGFGPALMLRETAGVILLWLMFLLVNTYHLVLPQVQPHSHCCNHFAASCSINYQIDSKHQNNCRRHIKMQDSLNKINSSIPKEWPFLLTKNESKYEMKV